jgi:hypothetical protein
LGVIKGLIHRAHEICDRKEDLLDEIGLLKDVFISMGYPPRSVEKIVKESWENELRKAVEPQQSKRSTESQFYNVIQAPYIRGFTEKLQNELRIINVGFVMKRSVTIGSMVSKLKPETDRINQKGVVYSIPCGICGKVYIGETGKTFAERRKQHQQDVKRHVESNALFQHKIHTNHAISWNDFRILDKEDNWRKRKMKEALFINAYNPCNSIDNVLNMDKGFKVNSCWTAILTKELTKEPRQNLNNGDVHETVENSNYRW